jgi:hypothetical protein
MEPAMGDRLNWSFQLFRREAWAGDTHVVLVVFSQRAAP